MKHHTLDTKTELKLRTMKVNFVMSVYPSGKTRLPLNGFS